MLGTDWKSGDARAADCKCNACSKRAPMRKEKKLEWLNTGKAKYLCADRCGGTRQCGDLNATLCSKRGSVTVCPGCYNVIEPRWLLSLAERKERLASGVTLEQLITINRELLEFEADESAAA